MYSVIGKLFVILLVFGISVAQDTFYFSRKPTDQPVTEGTELTLHCNVSNRRHISFQWIQNGKPVVNTSRKFQDDSNLRILRITRELDAGPFQCIATNATTGFSLQSGEASLDIQWIDPVATVELKKVKDQDVELGADLQLKCLVAGNPEPNFEWYQNQFLVFNKDHIKIVDNGARLKINGIKATDNGVYSCRAQNVAAAIDSVNNYILNVNAPDTPHLIEDKFTSYKLVLKNEAARLDCPFVNATRIEWFASYEKLSNSSRHSILSNGSLYFPRVRNSDAGGYRCEGLSADMPAQIFSSVLAIAYLNDITYHSFEPRLMTNFPLVISAQNEFTVKVFPPDGKPEPNYRWLNKNDMVIDSAGPIRTNGSDLYFENPQQSDSGNYTFIVKNTAAEKRQSVWIIVSVPPIIRRGPQQQEVTEGEDVRFSCQVTGTDYPVTTVIWQKNGNYIRLGSSRHRMNQQTGSLHILNVVEGDIGYYTCVANTTGQQLVYSQEAFLRIKKKLKFNPKPENTHLELDSDAEVRCHADAEINPKIHWMKGGTFTFAPHIIDADGTLYFRRVKITDAGLYTCVAVVNTGNTQQIINTTIYIDVVERPWFNLRPKNTTAYEEHPTMLHCMASGDPKPVISWLKNYGGNKWDRSRFTQFPNGTLHISKVFMEDKGTYLCIANNSAGIINTTAYLFVANGAAYGDGGTEEEEFDMMRTIIIAVCSAAAYLALVIGLTAYCSYRLLLNRRNRKNNMRTEKQNGNLTQEQHELLMKDRDRDSGGTQCRSDSDNRSHVSALSSHPSHSSHSNSQTQSQNLSHQSQRSVGKTSVDRLFFPRHELQMLGMLGKSQFGDVFLGKARGIRPGEIETQVVVKSLVTKEEHHYYEFQREIDMYSRLEHNNVIKVLGVCREIDPQFYIMEHCDWGDLKQFLLASRVDTNIRRVQRIPPLTIIQKIGMCNQVALGMEHLSNQRFIHRDLATRNVLLTSRLELKISHMALSRDVYMNEYVIRNLTAIPLRWLSPEAALEADYSTKSDVWAFGVFMWEVFHLGDLPHKTRTDEELLRGLKAGDTTLEISEHCPNEIIDLIRKCTAESPKDRPLFTDICNVIAELVTIYSQPQYGGPSPPQSTVSYPSVTPYMPVGYPGYPGPMGPVMS